MSHLRQAGLDAGQIDHGPINLLDLHGELVNGHLQLLTLLDEDSLKHGNTSYEFWTLVSVPIL